MSHSNQDAEEREFNRVRAIPFERINGCPTWQKYLKLKQQASKIAVGSEVDYDWTLCAAGHKYGLLADIIGGDEYEDITGIDRNEYDASLTKPAIYDASITSNTNTFQRERRTVVRNEELRWWYIRRGLHRGLRENFQDSLDSCYYEQLEHDITGYETVAPIAFLEHLKTVWCRLDTSAIKEMKDAYYEEWDSDTHITKFISKLNKGEKALARDGIVITAEDKLQHFILQMYASNCFDEKQMMEWEKKPTADKTWANATNYFKEIIREQETYAKLSGRSSKRARYESAAMAREKINKKSSKEEETAADLGDEVREYIARLTSEKSEEREQLYKAEQRHQHMADQAAEMKREMRTKDDQIAALTAQVATLTKSIETLTRTITCMPAMQAVQDGGEKEKKRGGDRRAKGYTAARNIGGYCWSHGWDPVGENHTSGSCRWKKEGHKAGATGSNKMGRSTWQPKQSQYNKQQASLRVQRE